MATAVRKWLSFNWTDRKQFAVSLLKEIRLGLLSDALLAELMDQMHELKECRDMFDEVVELKKIPKGQLMEGTPDFLYPHYFAPKTTITVRILCMQIDLDHANL